MAVIALLRHGQSSANVEGVLAGWLPGVGLTERGRDQATRTAAVLAGLAPVHLVTSPLQRCRETADLARGALELPVEVDEGLGECRYGAWTGRALRDLTAEPEWREVQDHPERAVFPPSEEHAHESLAAMTRRIAQTLTAIDRAVEADHGPDAVWVAVSHGDPIKAALAHAAGAGVAGLQRFHVDPASVTLIRRHERSGVERWMILSSNRTDHLGSSAAAPVRATSAPSQERSGEAVVGGGAGAE